MFGIGRIDPPRAHLPLLWAQTLYSSVVSQVQGPWLWVHYNSVSEMFRHRDRDQGCVFQSTPDEVHAVWALSLTPTIQNCGATTCVQVAHCLPVFLADDNR